ncbi:sepiapterin reductase [Mucor circinelloides 1006PhL]|uniref:Sepiapterin reductase n=1 Tax=Mucor circinelloides f. circinelloides (strain 1006PhL) TaxID=1220926 RepID=S2J713_MUCC1|nr:sepiapterin reductase [Mucor circinelloides 1006PhL]
MLLKHTVYIITGANRGFGKAIAETIASKVNQNRISFILVGRDQSQLESVKFDDNKFITCHYIANADFKGAKEAQVSVIDKISSLIKAWQENDTAPITNAVLINNAGSTGDLSKTVGDYDASEIQDYVDLNITSYISMVTGFIKLFNNGLINTTIVNISSLLAVEAFPNWALYATGKSARDMLLKVVTKEEPSIRTLSYAPGPLNNEMQQHVRETLGDQEQKQLYTKMADEGNLVDMKDSASRLYQLLAEDKFESGSHVDYYDLE